ncbi:arylacetamide deacetylase-like 3 [Oryctolagus cuniculus]|uniref:Arylacetamide deacetylase like 3 n=1 Tax=Oryctolagus cuniculus TaxID=9986 RepID=G1U6N5_RABIT|nr:arylacetamide deacetylase-like 3 isoform X1 [Oryctolagus cuniculus]
MVSLALLLLVAVCVLSSGVWLWAICTHFLRQDVPAGIGHPVKMRVLSCLTQLVITWGLVFEKLGICSMPQFVRFIHDLRVPKKDPDVLVTDLRFGTIRAKLYQPKASSSTPRPGVVFYHGGGTIMGSLRTHHGVYSYLSKKSDAVVLAVGYRKSPKYKFPVMVRDCMAATVQFLKTLNAYGVDPARVVVGGDSVGGGVATVVCQTFLNRPDLPRIRAQVLIYPALQALDFQSPSFQQNEKIPLLTWHLAFYCLCCYMDINPSWQSALKKGAHLPAKVWAKYDKWVGAENIPERFKKRGYQPVPRAPLNEDAYLETRVLLNLMCSPLIAEDSVMSQLPEACIVSCEYDLLRDHSLLYKKRLEDLGVPVTWHHMDDGFHGVLNTIDLGLLHFPCSKRILNLVVHFIRGL